MILQNRHRVARALKRITEARQLSRHVCQALALSALAYASIVGIVWSVRALSVDESLLRLTLSMFIVPVFIQRGPLV